jgi:electron transfer flavoprotein alpha subunit
MPRIFAFIPHANGIPDDSAAELAAAANLIDAAERPTAVLTGSGPELDEACGKVGGLYGKVWKVGHEELAYPNAELVRSALAQVIPSRAVFLVPHTHFGVDLAPGLSIRMDAAFVADVLDISASDGSALNLVRQEFGGQVSTHVRCDLSTGAVLTIRPGAFKPLSSATHGTAEVIDKSGGLGSLTAGRRYIGTVPAETGDVDITRHHVLVSVGRGIQDAENISIAQELAEAMGGAVSCSRPVVDAKWLDKSRQVGSSGKTVRPRVYLACGISGSYQHLAGLKGNPFLVAINKNPKAPIFRVANVGVVADVLEFLPELTARIRER